MKGNLYIIVIGVVVIILAAFFASSHPDGLEWVAERLGFLSAEAESPRPHLSYGIPAGIIGAVITGFIAYLIGKLLRRS